MQQIFWIVIKTLFVPLGSYYFLKGTDLGEQGAVFIVAIALTISTIFLVFTSFFKILGNTLLLKGKSIIYTVLTLIFQIAVTIFVWWYYLDKILNYSFL